VCPDHSAATTSSAYFQSNVVPAPATHVPTKRGLDVSGKPGSVSIALDDTESIDIDTVDENVDPFPRAKRPRASLDSGYGPGNMKVEDGTLPALTAPLRSSGSSAGIRQSDQQSRSSQAGLSELEVGDTSAMRRDLSTPNSEPQVSMPTSGQTREPDEVCPELTAEIFTIKRLTCSASIFSKQSNLAPNHCSISLSAKLEYSRSTSS
jgi:hypothetical protein